jgi:quinol monooxygenase YgiN
MIVVSGRFRLPLERIADARPYMAKVIAASSAEPGCRVYSYAEAIDEPGLFRVYEEWDGQAALEAHFTSSHMREWQAAREALGFHDRSIVAYEIENPLCL